MSVRPRDLPKHSSHKNISTLSTIPLNSIRTIPTGPTHKVIQVQNHYRQSSHIIPCGAEPTIQISYAFAA